MRRKQRARQPRGRYVTQTSRPGGRKPRRPRRSLTPLVALAVLIVAIVAVGAVLASVGSAPAPRTDQDPPRDADAAPAAPAREAIASRSNIYALTAPHDMSPAVKGDPALVYVPNSVSDTVDVISQRTFRIVRQFPAGALPQHVTPAWNLKTLYVDNDVGNSLTPINPRTGKPGRSIPVEDPYNLYFTPDGRYAIVVAERLARLDFRNPNNMRLVHSLSVPGCRGIDHMDFSANGRYLYASCEFASRMIEVDLRTQRVVRSVLLGGGGASPQDVKLSPDGRTLYAADQVNAGLWELNPRNLRVIGFLHTGSGAHGLYPSRNDRFMYVSNRAAGSISVVSFKTKHVVKTWQLPLPASPDMGGVSANGKTLWLTGRYDAVVYAINTQTGRLRATIPVGEGPHGLCVWPQPGRYSLGHTGILR